MRLETVRNLTRDRDLAERHILFLSAERDKLKAKPELTEDEALRLKELESRLEDVTRYLAQLKPRLHDAIVELSEKIRQLPDKKQSLMLFEVYVLLVPIRATAQILGLNDTAAYNMHSKARDAYNTAQGIPLYKDGRGHKKWSDYD